MNNDNGIHYPIKTHSISRELNKHIFSLDTILFPMGFHENDFNPKQR